MKNNKNTFKIHHWMLFLLLVFSFSISYAQEKFKLSGTVTDDQGIPLPGVNILVRETNNGAVSDFDGAYSIELAKGNTLIFSSVAFVTQSIVVGDQKNVNVVLATDSNELDQVIVVGYGTQRKIEVTGAVNTISSETISRAPVSDVGEALQGQVAGVNIQSSSGRPGENANIQIRGVGSLSPNALAPLFIVDGIPYESNPNIAPEQVESMSVLKDGASAAVYGVRGANGVILITTKKGKQGQLKADYSSYLAVQNITSGVPLANTRQQLFSDEVVNETNGTVSSVLFLNPNALDFDSDFVGDVQNNNALIQNHSINVSGGSENLSLNLNGSYFDQEGVLINSGFNRFTTRITGQYTKDRLKIFASMGITDENREQEPFGLLGQAVAQRPYQPPLANVAPVNGVVRLGVGSGQPELLSFLTRLLGNEDNRTIRSSNIALNAQYELVPGLTYKVNFGRNTFDFRRKFLRPQYLLFNVEGNFVPGASREDAFLQESFLLSQRTTVENSLRYNLKLDEHTFNFLALASAEEFNSKSIGTGVIGLASNDTDVLGQGNEAIKPTGGELSTKINGFLGRIQYNYADRYLLSGSLRRDGSSNFSSDNAYENFFGVSAGWNVSEEPFFKNANINAISNLKFRGSIAEVGNQSIGFCRFCTVIDSGVNFIFDSDIANGQIARTIVDPNIKWETKISRNIGVDLSMFSNKLSLTADYYVNERRDLLLEEQLPPSSGTNAPRANALSRRVTNAGNLTNKGIELAISYKGQTSYGLEWTVSGTFTQNENEITSLNGVKRGFAGGVPLLTVANIDNTTFLAEGFEAGAFFLLENDGVIKTEERLARYQEIVPTARLGDIAYIDQNTVDTNGDGIPNAKDGVITDDDRVYAGSGQPEFEAGLSLNLNYKGFDFYIQNYLAYGSEVYNGARLAAYTNGRHLEQFNQWSPENRNSDIPARRAGQTSESTRARSDYFLEDGTYWRIRNLTFGYSLDKESLPSFFEKARVYVSAQNPFTFTEYTGFDPEIGGDGIFTRGVDRLTYPVSRRILFGVQLSF